MSIPIKHHFVPQIYLKRFSYDSLGNLYTLSIKSKYKVNVKSFNKSQICYKKNRYKFDNEEIIENSKIEDLYAIEKLAFNYEDEELTELFDKVDGQKNISTDEFIRLIQIIIDIKSRNPSFSKKYENLNLESISTFSEVEKVKVIAEQFCANKGFDKNLVDIAVKEVKKKFENKNYRYNTYLKSFMAENKAQNDAVSLLAGWEVIVYFTGTENPFITSDNPGFSFDKQNRVMNTDFSFADAFAIPISPKSLLCFRRNKENAVSNQILYQAASQETVLIFNKTISVTCNKIIISNLENQLQLLKT